ncbi:MAG: 16S rRNA (guanine(966)-N(2))-methyltransferase RsmD [Lachnospiraceae bacterium]|nr:16S rRNA (guanine(966)-N(2))-methyltransferase RsmD [Lachnospiraceae bacterium]
MRIIAGKARSLPLKTTPGTETRPTTDRIKETLFNMLQTSVADCRFLDLFAGSGQIGLEAISRGAAHAVFVEKDKAAAACIQSNISFTKFDDQCTLYVCDVLAALRRMEGQEPFDIIFMDPPYDRQCEQEVLAYLADSTLAAAHTLILVEASLRTDFSRLDELGFVMEKWKPYKTNGHAFIRKKGRT